MSIEFPTFLPARRLDERPLPSSNTVPHCRALSRTVPRDVARDARARVDAFVDAMFTSFVLMAVKKGPFARGGIIWKTHAFAKMSQTRQRNALKNARLIQGVEKALKKAAALDPASRAAKVSAAPPSP